MIAKRVPMRKLHKSSFAGLASYIANSQGKHERVEKVSITNCESEDLEWAIKEIQATQEQNTRAKSDKTYHLIVSFREGERPNDEVLRSIEERICDGLGYGEHQRISAVHNDTDNLHIHIAINKIHPTRLTIFEPYFDKRTLLNLCAELEVAHGLQIDNHQPKADAVRTRAADMERAGGMESLIGWIKRECLPAMDSVQDWNQMHEVLAHHGLQLQRRGNGLAISNEAGLVVRASSVRRDMSLSALERKFGAFQEAVDFTNAPKTSDAPASIVEREQGIDGLRQWIRTECLGPINRAQSWQEMYQAMEQQGLRLEMRQRGIVFHTKSGVSIEADSIRPNWTRSEFGRRFGGFREGLHWKAEGAMSATEASDRNQTREGRQSKYERRPVTSRIDTSKLYERYQNFHQQNREVRSAQWGAAIKRRDQLIADAKRNAKIKRGLLGMTRGVSRKILLTMVSKSLVKEIAQINDEYQRTKKTLFASTQRPAWTDWLQSQARAGDTEAIAVLRARAAKSPLAGNTVAPVGATQTDALAEPNPDGVTKKGTVIYRAGTGAIRDDGQRLQVSAQPTQAELTKALRIAADRGSSAALDVHGSQSFKDRLAVTAATSNLDVRFSNPQLEKRHQSVKRTVAVRQSKQTLRAAGARLLGVLANQAVPPLARKALRYLHDAIKPSVLPRSQTKPYPPTTSKEKIHVRRDHAAIRPTNGAAAPTGFREFPGERYRGTTNGKPNIGRVGTVPPPSNRYRLRDLSERSLVLGAEPGSVLLPRDVSDHLGQHQAQGDHVLRRDIRGTGGGIKPADSVDIYVAERNAKREYIADIPKHKRYNDQSGNKFLFAGSRVIEGQQLALLKSGDEVYVLQIDPKDAAAFRRVKVGGAVEITEMGKLKRKGRTQ